MKLNYKNIRLSAIVVGALFILYAIFSTVKGIISASEVGATRKAIVESIPPEYAHLFNNEDRLKNPFTELSTIRYPISYFGYDNNKYCIVVTKLKAPQNALLDTLIKEELNNETIDERGGYLMISRFNVNLFYLPKSLKASKVFLHLNGDSIATIIKSDTVRSYYLKMKSFSLKYEKNGIDDLFAISKGNSVPVYLVFIKRKESLYFIFMSVNYDDSLQPKLLNKLFLNSQ